MSRQLDRDRPLWEIRIADRLADGRIAVIGKAHHCMVDGIAAVELASLLLDPTPDVPAQEGDGWSPDPAPTAATRVAEGLGAKASGPMARITFRRSRMRRSRASATRTCAICGLTCAR